MSATQPTHFDELHSKLSEFLAHNPNAKLETDERGPFISNPWEDTSLVLRLQEDTDKLVDALNAVYLPQPLTAVWHRDLKDLEVIWGPVTRDRDECTRAYEFKFKGTPYRCDFGPPSARLLAIAMSSRPSGKLPTANYRNLREFVTYERARTTTPESNLVRTMCPMCFWIRGVEWDEEAVLELVHHLNFYNSYFDRRCPRILTHSEPLPGATNVESIRYPFGSFPSTVFGRQLDPYLLSLWEAVLNTTAPFRIYIYSYQIIEYAAFYYLSESVAQGVRRILAAPEIAVRPTEAAHQILDILADFRSSDDEKIVAVIRQVSDPSTLWREIEPNLGTFSAETDFEGGFSLPPLVQRDWSLEDFRTIWPSSVAHSLRKLRNALVHGREARMAKVVLPTRTNYARLRPWRELLTTIAAQTIVYEV